MTAEQDRRPEATEGASDERRADLEPTSLDRAMGTGTVWQGRSKRAHVPYHQMSTEERRAAWAKLREQQGRIARKHSRAPMIFFGLAAAAWVVGGILGHFGFGFYGVVSLWLGVGLAGFGAVALARNVMGGLAGRKDDVTPPGF